MNLKREVLAAVTTFTTMAYVVVVNPFILSQAGMDFGAVMTATILTSAFATFLMGIFARYPFALAPGMGLNAYFAYSVVLGKGVSWEAALGACFFAGLILIVLNMLGIRKALMEAIPAGIRTGTIAGIGIFLMFIGLREAGLVTGHEQTLIAMGKVSAPEVLLTVLGVVAIVAMLHLEIPGAVLIAIFLNWAAGLLLGLAEWKGVVALPPSLAPTFLALDLKAALSPELIPIILSFVFINIFEAAGTILGLAKSCGALDSEGKVPRVKRAFFCDSGGTLLGSLLGTSPITTYLESASGISCGGRSGLTALLVSLFFLCTLFFSPLAASIPAFATAPALIVVGGLMAATMRELPWEDATEYFPGLIALIAIPLTFSIAGGIGIAFFCYAGVKLLTGKVKETGWLTWLITALFLLQFYYSEG